MNLQVNNINRFHEVNIDDYTTVRFHLETGKLHINDKTYTIKKGKEIIDGSYTQFFDIQKITTLALRIVHQEMDVKNLKKMTIDEQEIQYFGNEKHEGTINLTHENIKLKKEEIDKHKKLYNNIFNSKEKEEKLKKLLLNAFGTEKIKLTLEETIDHLHKEYISPEELKDEVQHFRNEKIAREKMVKRLAVYAIADLDFRNQSPSLTKRHASTGYEISILKEIEKAFKKAILSQKHEATVTSLKQHNINVIIAGRDILIEEHELRGGSFKMVTTASNYFTMKTPEERNAYVTLKLSPKKLKINNLYEQVNEEIKEGENSSECGTIVSKSNVENNKIYWNEVKEIIPLKDLPIEKLTLEQMEERLEELQNDLNEPTAKEQFYLLESCMITRKKENELLNNYHAMNDQEEYAYEIDLTKKFKGDGVIDVHDVVDLANKDKVMVQEAAGFKLQSGMTVVDLAKMKKMHLKNLLTNEEVIKMMEIFLQALRGVERLHQLGYIHRDLKEENILITKEGKGVLSDFGTAVRKKDDPIKAKYIGTIRYSAPETLKYDRQEQWNIIDEKCDIWSCGMILQNLFAEGGLDKHPAINDKSPHLLRELNKNLDTPQNKKKYEQSYPEPKEETSIEYLIWKATKIDPKERPTITEFCTKLQKIIEMEKKK